MSYLVNGQWILGSNATFFPFLFLLKVKQLLTGGGTSKKNKTATTSTSSVLTSSAGGGNSSTLKSDKLIRERRPVIDSDHSRSRFSETRTSELQSEFVEPQVSLVYSKENSLRGLLDLVVLVARETCFCCRSPN